MSIKDLVEVYIKYIFIQHGILKKIILDRDPKFITVFWEVFTAL